MKIYFTTDPAHGIPGAPPTPPEFLIPHSQSGRSGRDIMYVKGGTIYRTGERGVIRANEIKTICKRLLRRPQPVLIDHPKGWGGWRRSEEAYEIYNAVALNMLDAGAPSVAQYGVDGTAHITDSEVAYVPLHLCVEKPQSKLLWVPCVHQWTSGRKLRSEDADGYWTDSDLAIMGDHAGIIGADLILWFDRSYWRTEDYRMTMTIATNLLERFGGEE